MSKFKPDDPVNAGSGVVLEVVTDLDNGGESVHVQWSGGRSEWVSAADLELAPQCLWCETASDMYPFLYGDLCVDCYSDANGGYNGERSKPLSKRKIIAFLEQKAIGSRYAEERERARQMLDKLAA